MCVCDYIVGLVISIKKAESLNGLESLYSALSQQTFGELDLSLVSQAI